MMGQYYGQFGQYMGQMMNTNYYGNFGFPAWFWGFLPALMIWGLVWKGLALWTAARSGSKPWFVALLIINTLGILEILYIFWFSKKDDTQPVK